MNRRAFLNTLAHAGLVSTAFGEIAWAERGIESTYARAIVIDAQGGPGDFTPNAPQDAPLSLRALADVRRSGVTASILTVGSVGNGPGKFEQTVAQIALCERDIDDHPDALLKVRIARDLDIAKASGRMGLIYGFQDTSMLDGDLSRLALFHGLGVRVVQMTYNRRNLAGDGCLESNDGGLSSFGRQVVGELNRLNMLLDLSHGSARTIAEGIAASRSAMTISHTGCRSLVDVPRNTDDRNLRALADKGGVAGIYFMPFLRESGQPHAEDLIRHLERAVNVCGEDHVGLGTDGALSGVNIDDAYRAYQRKFYEDRAREGIAAPGEAPDVFNLLPEYNDARRFATLANDLAGRGWQASRIEKILGGNFVRLFRELWRG